MGRLGLLLLERDFGAFGVRSRAVSAKKGPSMRIEVWFDNPRVEKGGSTMKAWAFVRLCTFALRLMRAVSSSALVARQAGKYGRND